jgi:hypothetical protein
MTFVSVGNISNVLGPLYAKILGEDEPFRKRRLTGHVFEGQFEEMHISEVMAEVCDNLYYFGETELMWPDLGSHLDLRSGTQHPSPTSTNSLAECEGSGVEREGRISLGARGSV